MPDCIPRPFLKWAGGKRQLLSELLARVPAAFEHYHEPFIGSGALFFALCRHGRVRHAAISDLNQELIDTYLAIRDGVDEVIALLRDFPYDREFYYALRARDPWSLALPLRAARMIYLNKTGYNGLYRVNRAGKFNVPFGRHKAPNYCNEENLRAVSVALQDTDIACAPHDSVLITTAPGDLVYFDPPYAPLSATANFTAYHANRFSADDQAHLRDVCVKLTRAGVYVLLSNSDTELVRTLYAGWPFTINQVHANRAINSNARRRGKIAELLVVNYG